MCGILGYATWRGAMPAVGDLCRLTNLLRHRGPDAGGYWTEPGVFFGHRRLSIVDLSASGAQPMSSANGQRWPARSITAATVAGSISDGVPPPKKMLPSTRPGVWSA